MLCSSILRPGSRRLALAILWLAAMAAGCAGGDPNAGTTTRVPPTIAGGSAAPPPVNTIPDTNPPPPKPVCPPENPFCGMTGAQQPMKGDCGNAPIDLKPQGVNVMIAIDGSASMAPFWPEVQNAVRRLHARNPTGGFGVHMFFGNFIEDLDALFEKSNLCGKTENMVLDVGQRTADELVAFMGDWPPGPPGFFPSSPLVEPINYYLTNASQLTDPTRTNYLVIISDGEDNCFGSAYTNPADKRLALEKVAMELAKINIRLVPISFVAGQASGMPADDWTAARIQALDTLAKHGGSGLERAFAAEKAEDLIAAIDQVGSAVGNCRFSIPATLDPTQSLNPFELTFALNGVAVERDRLNVQGWNFVGGGTSEVEFYGQSCEAIRGGATLEARKTCMTEVCGTAAVEVQTKERVVMYLLDASASRIECVGADPFGCLWGAGQGVDRAELTFWETVEHALGQSLVAPINDDVRFGLQFFPTSDLLSCDFATEPVVPPAEGTAISIMSKMFERLPFGASPVVAALEGMAANPGRLADPNVSAALVVLTDGGDNCSGVEQPQIAQRLGASAAKLLAAGAPTYVVRFGKPENKTPELEEQLRAIVMNGGTATLDPNNPSLPPYIDAKDASSLDAALAQLSDRLATCAFSVSGLPEKADKNLANLYLNGELIRFDQAKAKVDGWGWANAEQTEIELYGAACEAFKTNRKTSAIVEFGCEQVPVMGPD